MKRSSMFSRSFFRRPAVRDLVPELKLVLAVLIVGCESHAGVYLPGGLGEDCGLAPSSLAGALVDLERRGHILTDKKTGEVFINGFYRDNAFRGAQRVAQWQTDFNQIESELLRRAVLEAIKLSPECGISVDNSTKINKKQPPNSLVLGVVVDKEKASSSPASPAAENQNPQTLAARLEELRAAGARTSGCDLEKDRAAIQAVRDIAAWLGDGVVIEAIALASYPSQALTACRDAGLPEAVKQAKQQEAATNGEARRAKLMEESNHRLVKMMGSNEAVINKGKALLKKKAA